MTEPIEEDDILGITLPSPQTNNQLVTRPTSDIIPFPHSQGYNIQSDLTPWNYEFSTNKLLPKRALSPELVRTSPTTYGYVAKTQSIIATSTNRDALLLEQARVNTQISTLQEEIKLITSQDENLSKKRNKKKVEDLQSQLLESDRARLALESKIAYLEGSFNLRGLSLAFSAEQKIAAVINESDLQINRLISASTEEKKALTNNFQLHIANLQKIFEDKARDYVQEELQKQQKKLDELNAKYNTSEQLRIQAENNYIQANNRAQSAEFEYQRITDQHNSLGEYYNLGLAENQKLKQEIQTTEEKIRILNDEILELKKQRADLSDNILRLEQLQTPMKEQIRILEQSIQTANDQIKQAPVVTENLIAQSTSEANEKIATLSNQLSTLGAKYQADTERAQKKITQLRADLMIANEKLQNQLKDNIDLHNQQRQAIQSPTSQKQPTSSIYPKLDTLIDTEERTRQRPLIPNFTDNSKMGETDALARVFDKFFHDLSNKESKNNIPEYKGTSQDKPITVWLKQAEKVARKNRWSDEATIKYLGSRLTGKAENWCIDRYDEVGEESYQTWRAALLEKFNTAADLDKLKEQFESIRQKADESTEDFVDRLYRKYRLIYPGYDEYKMSDQDDDNLLKAFLKGMKPHIKEAMYTRIQPNAKWQEHVTAAIEADGVLSQKERQEKKAINNIDSVSQKVISDQTKKIEALEKELKTLKIPQDPKTSSKTPLVANINYSSQGKPYKNSSKQVVQSKSQGYKPRQFNNSNRGQAPSQTRFWSPPNQYYQRTPFYQPKGHNNYNPRQQGYTPRQPSQGHYTPRATSNDTWRAPTHAPRPRSPYPSHKYSNSYAAPVQKNVVCYKCGLEGHIAPKCTRRPTSQQGHRPRP